MAGISVDGEQSHAGGGGGIDGRAPRGRRSIGAEAIELTASRLRIVADPARIALLEALNASEGAVCDLAEQVDLPHKNVSRHLLALHQVGTLSRRREGRQVLYAMADWSAWWVVEQLARSVEAALGEES